MSELHRIDESGAAPLADVVFVHGLGGDPFATWWHNPETPRDSWPFWLAEDLPQVAVHCLAYDASPSKWLGSSMPLVDRATNVLTRLEADGMGLRPLFFVCHSLGGLLAKQVLRSALELGESAWREIVDNTRAIVFLATPHTGARLADYLGALGKVLRLTVSVGELEASAPALRDLNVWYRQNARRLGIDTLAMFETRDTRGVRVVDEASADAGQGVPRAIDADHFSICKPRGRSDLAYGAVKNFVSQHVPGSQLSAVEAAASRPYRKNLTGVTLTTDVPLAPPGGIVRLDDKFYVRRRADDLVEGAARRVGETLVIKGPAQFGKSSLLLRYLAMCEAEGKRYAYLNFQTFTSAELTEYPTLLTHIARHMLRVFKLGSPEMVTIRNQADLSSFVEDEIISNIYAPTTFAFDEVDRLLGRSYQDDFFSMLRLWHNRRAEPLSPWEQVDLALVITTEPYLLIDSRERSPFNVTIPIEPGLLSRAAMDSLSNLYGCQFNQSELDRLYELLGGHPHLTRLSFYLLRTGQISSLDELDRRAGDRDGPFKHHLGEMLGLLQQHEGLLAAMRHTVAYRTVPNDEAYHRLHGAGLVKHEGRHVVPANLLYARFFGGHR